MTSSKHSSRRTILYVIAIGIGILIGFLVAPALDTDDAQAHVPPASSCDAIWRAAPVGTKWAAKQRCIAAQRRHSCVTHPRVVPGTVRVKGARLSPGGSRDWVNQRKVIGWVVNTGLRRGLPRKVVLSALVAGTQESALRELTYGHDTSVGPFQLINSHGSFAQRVSVEFSGNWYFNGAMKVLHADPRIGVAQLAQAVEQSGFPGEYGQWIPESNRTLDAVLGTCRLT